MFFRQGTHPDGDGVVEQQGQGLGVRGQAAAGFDDRRLMLGQDGLQALTFEAPVTRLSMQLQNFADGRSVFPLDLAVEFEKRYSPFPRQPASQRGLAGSAQSDQRD